MTVRRRKLMMSITAAVAVAGAMAVVGFGLGQPVEVTPPPPSASLREAPVEPAAARDDSPEDSDVGDEHSTSLRRLRGLASLDLRRPLFAPEKPPADTSPDNANQRPALSIELLGTIDEPGHAYAIVSYPGSPGELRGVGERFDTPAGPVTIVEITARRAILQYRGEQRELKMPEPEALR